jgi:AmmeMemoRadiSam system protein B/AmmeMemoRadiSam system protein A
MKRLLWLIVTAAACSVAAEVRPPAVAGSFYPAEPGELRSEVERLLGEARSGDESRTARAVVVPHAGFVYSGPTAAVAFARLPAEGVRRVILLGPSHHFSFTGGALPAEGITAFETPLGRMAIDRDAVAVLRRQPGFAGPARAHGPEHSLEVEIPFLQVMAPEAELVPIAVGNATDLNACFEMAKALAALLDEGTVVVASSDFTHHGDRYGWSPYSGPDLPDTLLEVGRRTAERAAAMDPRGFVKQIEVSGDTVCGVRPVGVLAALLAHTLDGTGQVLQVTTSGHVTGQFDLSVTYAAIVFDGSWSKWEAHRETKPGELGSGDGEALIALARAVLQTRLSHDTALAGWFAEHPDTDRLLRPFGAFVTLNNTGKAARQDGKLRACMGIIEAEQPLVDAVIQAAVWAARDPRFPPLELTELDGISLEVSVLSPMQPVASHRFIEVGTHGVVMAKDGRRAVFLPQVATEQGWNRETMLEHLSVKAGLPRTAWQHGARFEVFTAQVFSEAPE